MSRLKRILLVMIWYMQSVILLKCDLGINVRDCEACHLLAARYCKAVSWECVVESAFGGSRSKRDGYVRTRPRHCVHFSWSTSKRPCRPSSGSPCSALNYGQYDH